MAKLLGVLQACSLRRGDFFIVFPYLLLFFVFFPVGHKYRRRTKKFPPFKGANKGIFPEIFEIVRGSVFLHFGLWTSDLPIFDLKIGFLVENCIYGQAGVSKIRQTS